VPTSTPIPEPAGETRAQDSAGDEPVRDVVVGVDGSECALAAVRWAAQEAGRRGAPLRILHAAPYLTRRGPDGGPPPEMPRARGITAVAYTTARHTAPGVRAVTEVVPEEPTAALLRASAAGQLVVLGSSTTGAADEMVLAPVALRVAARSPRPVVVVPRRRQGTPADRPFVAVLGIGDRAEDEAVAELAAAWAGQAGSALSVVQIGPADRKDPAGWVDDPAEWTRRFPGLDVRLRSLPSAKSDALLRAIGRAPLLVISTGRGNLLHRTLDGSHRYLLRHSTSPVALVPPAHRAELDPSPDVVAVG
jgi:nucleotide-binding universal stress UspA family protein